MNSVYFFKNQRQQMHKLIDFIIDYNNSLPYENHEWLRPIQMKVYNEDDATIIEFDDPAECEGFQWIDESHYVAPDKCRPIWLDIDEEARYTISMGEFSHNYDIEGSKIRNFIDKEYYKENAKIKKDMEGQ